MTNDEDIDIYHIVHVDNLSSIVADGYLYSDAEMRKRPGNIDIGMKRVKDRRLALSLSSHPGLHVGECVPFYFCPRSVMLYLMYRSNSADIEYCGGQAPIIHLVANLKRTIEWAVSKNLRWAFTTSNAGAYYFDDYADIQQLDEIDWAAVKTNEWSAREVKEKKQAEFLIERCFPCELITEIGVYSQQQLERVNKVTADSPMKNALPKVQQTWYY